MTSEQIKKDAIAYYYRLREDGFNHAEALGEVVTYVLRCSVLIGIKAPK